MVLLQTPVYLQIMFIDPTLDEVLARARADLRMGLPVRLSVPDGDWLVAPAETVSANRMEIMRRLGNLTLAVTARRAETLKARIYDSDLARLSVPDDKDLGWVQTLADPADDLRYPLRGPLLSQRDGPAHAHRLAIELCKTARLLPAALLAPIVVATPSLTNVTISASAHVQATPVLNEVASARVPLRHAERTRLRIFRPADGSEEHYAIVIGQPNRDAPVLVRLHSACFTGDLLGSLKCDCGPQLNAALEQMGQEGAGILLYLQQEGRGIGLANKMRAYALQDQGFDTVEANHRLGFEDDERDFRLGSIMLDRMGINSVRLMTNNPGKISMMEAQGIQVDARVPIKVGQTSHNANYLATKAAKSGHML